MSSSAKNEKAETILKKYSQSPSIISVVEMHSGGDPMRIVFDGFPEIKGDTILQKLHYAKSHFAIDFQLVSPTEPETLINIQAPCGLVKTHVEYKNGKTGATRFQSVPAFVFATDVEVDIAGHGKVKVDIAYGGCYFAFVPAHSFRLDLQKSNHNDMIKVYKEIRDLLTKQVSLEHPESNDEEVLKISGVIFTDGNDEFCNEPTVHTCAYGKSQICRAPCGSGTIAHTALQYYKGQISVGQVRTFMSGVTGSKFMSTVVRETKYGKYDAVIVELSGNGYYTGMANYMVENEDKLKDGFNII
ncbi:trans-L-3-hydroxyproline dehydratase-like [Saccoglossus kowalevskii]|uniref:trans-L-3-hydroxyproline dehydratase n=1 Tax=Saccoglossus kowalevskii TaxID=10224 RepID=A0ABM0GWY0_SACKO|nr:PREDICTED: trans-L-3-hydroxyproline dehydratase-like [Saccoglossus kowalevskii]